jgi:c-di-GMP-binding flagellar brake protein YcgR
MDEKRKYKRFKKEIKIEFEILTLMGTSRKISIEGESISIDISKGGMLFECFEAIPISSLIEIKVTLSGSDTPLYLKARVVRIIEIMENQRYDIGVKFIAVSEEDTKILNSLLISEN